MSDKPILQPGPDHPIAIEPNPGRVVVKVAGKVLVDTKNSVTLREADYPPVEYVPLSEIDPALLEPTDNESYCPYKGEAGYYSVPAGGARSANAVWEYKAPYPPVAELLGRVAFYPDRVDSIEQQ
jgi:uncharacterized protein (DUF427 family)